MAKMSAVARAAGAGGRMDENEHLSVSCRQISNGYLISHTRSTKDGGYESTETYHEKKPDIEAALRKVAKGKVRDT